MEANCCLSSPNTVAKTSAKLLVTGAIHFPCSTPTSNLSSFFHPNRIRLAPSITCCQFSGSSGDNHRHGRSFLDADWRRFRAQLVANEQSFVTGTTISPDSAAAEVVADHHPDPKPPPIVTVGDRWAHAIHEPEKGCLLIATEKLDGVHIFERTVILILSTGLLGPFGIILNRPSLMSIKETAQHLPTAFSGRPLFFGGPLEEGLFLVRPRGGYDGDSVGRSGVFDEVMGGLYYGTKESAGCAAEMVKRNAVGVGDFKFFDGYCGWEADQLREEIDAGYWTLAACSASVIGLDKEDAAGLWEDVSWLVGPKTVS